MPAAKDRDIGAIKPQERFVVETLVWEDEEQQEFERALEDWVAGCVTYSELRQKVPHRYRNLIQGILDKYVNMWLHHKSKAA